jgi:hypothetical protein
MTCSNSPVVGDENPVQLAFFVKDGDLKRQVKPENRRALHKSAIHGDQSTRPLQDFNSLLTSTWGDIFANGVWCDHIKLFPLHQLSRVLYNLPNTVMLHILLQASWRKSSIKVFSFSR